MPNEEVLNLRKDNNNGPRINNPFEHTMNNKNIPIPQGTNLRRESLTFRKSDAHRLGWRAFQGGNSTKITRTTKRYLKIKVM